MHPEQFGYPDVRGAADSPGRPDREQRLCSKAAGEERDLLPPLQTHPTLRGHRHMRIRQGQASQQ